MRASNRVIHFFSDVSMRLGHPGLEELAKGGKVAIGALKPGEFAAFFNKKFTAMKLLGPHGVLVHWRTEEGEPLYSGIISSLPHFLSGADIGYARDIAAAIAKHYESKLSRKRKGKAA